MNHSEQLEDFARGLLGAPGRRGRPSKAFKDGTSLASALHTHPSALAALRIFAAAYFPDLQVAVVQRIAAAALKDGEKFRRGKKR